MQRKSELLSQMKKRVEFFHNQIQAYLENLTAEANGHYEAYVTEFDKVKQ